MRPTPCRSSCSWLPRMALPKWIAKRPPAIRPRAKPGIGAPPRNFSSDYWRSFYIWKTSSAHDPLPGQYGIGGSQGPVNVQAVGGKVTAQRPATHGEFIHNLLAPGKKSVTFTSGLTQDVAAKWSRVTILYNTIKAHLPQTKPSGKPPMHKIQERP